MLSINPPTFSTGMFSWFPIYFPLRDPYYIKEGEIITVCFWRKIVSHKVWYEWCLVSPSVSYIHNQGGKNYWIGL